MPTVLIVDDDRALVRVLSMYFENEGYQVVTAGSGQEALNQIRRQRADVILLDVMMPDINGIEICRRVRFEPDATTAPIVIMTADQRYEAPALEAGADRFISKPFGLEALGKAVRGLVDR